MTFLPLHVASSKATVMDMTVQEECRDQTTVGGKLELKEKEALAWHVEKGHLGSGEQNVTRTKGTEFSKVVNGQLRLESACCVGHIFGWKVITGLAWVV